jgi:exopolysaccharide biosynthesis predicted pyruvyltransferase EpsI
VIGAPGQIQPAGDREPAAALVERLRGVLRERLGGLLPSGTRVALLDFPNHANVGDTAIWLGEQALLRELGCEVAYTASFSSYSSSMARRAVGRSGVILLSGGGNLGDLWPTFQAFRERVIEAHPRNPIVQLPQTVHFAQPASAKRAADVFSSHPDLTIMVRDRPSEEFARRTFTSCRVVAAPDMAFGLGALPVPEPTSELVLLMRTDRERLEGTSGRMPEEVAPVEWPPGRTGRLGRRYRLSRALGFPAKRSPAAAYLLDRPLRHVFDRLGAERMAVGLAIVGSGSVVVTDRLHGHILSLLLGRPHVLLDNSYGKVRGFWERWTADSPITDWATDLDSALKRAHSIAARAQP